MLSIKFVLTGTLLFIFAPLRVALAQPAATKPAAPKPAAISSGPRKLALLVGISKYERGRGDKDWPSLACDTDLSTMKKVLMSRFGFAAKDILLLTDAKATRKGIVDGFRSHLTAQARPGDIAVFHFSGHGQPVADDNGDELDGLDESLVPFDYVSQSAIDGAKTNLRDDQLGLLMTELRRKMQGADGRVQGNITAFLDSCHSGTATRGVAPGGRLRVRGRGWNTALDGPKPKPKVVKTRGGSAANDAKSENESAGGLFSRGQALAQGYVVLSACSSDQLAKETENEQGVGMGAFTYFVTRALAGAQPGATYRDIFERISVDLAGAVSEQAPQLEGEIDKKLFADATLPATSYLVVSDVSDTGFSVPAGSLQGITKGSQFALFRAGTDVGDVKNRLAEAEIVSVDATFSQMRLLAAYKGKIKPEQLRAARAVETSHAYGSDQIKVWVEVKEEAKNEAKNDVKLEETLAKISAVTTQGVSATNYDVRLAAEGNSYVLTRKSGSVLAKIELQNLASLRETLLGEWRWRFLTKLRNDNPRSAVKMELRLVPVNAETDDAGRVTKVISDRTDIKAGDGNRLAFRDGDFVMLELRNTGDTEAYATIIDLSPDGGINPIFPHPDAPGIFDNKIPAGKAWHRIRGTPDNPFVLRIGEPFGSEVFKVIATKEPADFRPLLSASSVAKRGAADLLSTVSANNNPLGQLLLSGVTGAQRGVGYAGVPPTNWATSDVLFEVQPR